MVTIITGGIHSGKTTRLIDEFGRCGRGCGFASVKIMKDGNVLGFDILNLSSGELRPLARRTAETDAGWTECCSMGPYSFSLDAVHAVEIEIEKGIREGGFTIFLDEAGQLELEGKCLDGILEKAFSTGIDIFITVRDRFLEEMIEKYKIRDARIINVGGRKA
ncbi:MAG: nucleoside-triphosphatase [Clostridia bacterium]